MNNRQPKGIPVGGQFAASARGEADVPPADPLAGRDTLAGVPYDEQPHAMARVITYRDMGRGYSQVDQDVEIDITDFLQSHPEVLEEFSEENGIPIEGVDPDTYEPRISYGGSLDHGNDFGDMGSGGGWIGHTDLDIPMGNAGTDVNIDGACASYIQECRERGVRPFSDVAGHAQRVAETRQQRADLRAAEADSALSSAAESIRRPKETVALAKVRAALDLYQSASRAAATETIDRMRDLGARRGAAFMVLGNPESHGGDIGYPTFYSADGEWVGDVGNSEIDSDPSVMAWSSMIRSREALGDFEPKHDPATEPFLSTRAARGNRYIYACVPLSDQAAASIERQSQS